jgi:hypothetical protein
MMQDNYEAAGPPTSDEAETAASGEVVRRPRFAAGARATILMGLTMGAVTAVVVSAAMSHTVSGP